MENRLKAFLILDGSGSGDGSGYGSGYGDGSGSGYGYGYGYGSGDGYGYGDGIKKINENEVSIIDGIPTIITVIRNNVAKGYILNKDLTLSRCYVVKNNQYFAHGATLKDAFKALNEKTFENLDTEETIDKFCNEFEKNKKYSCKTLYEWHHYLTGSCEMGRQTFMSNHGITFDDEFTVDEFIGLTENDYGGDIIKQLKEEWNNKNNS